MIKKLILACTVALAATFTLAQVDVIPGTPQQVSQALSESPGHWAREAIETVLHEGLFIGYPDGTYEWSQNMTRAEVAMVFARLIKGYNLELFNPDEITALRRAVDELNSDLAGLRALLDGELSEVANQLGRHTSEIAQLRDALAALDAAPEAFDAAGLWQELAQHDNRISALENQTAALENQLAGLASGAAADDVSELRAQLAALSDELAAERSARADLEARLADLEARVSALENQGSSAIDLSPRIVLLEDHASDLEARLTSIEDQLAGMSDTLADHEARIAHIEDTLLPDRNAFYVSLAVYGSSPDEGLVGQVIVGHDALYYNMGARVSADFGFENVPLSVAAAVTYRATMGMVDGYAGAGGGAIFEESDPIMFGEIIVGTSVRIFNNFGVYIEGRYRPLFDGSGDNRSFLVGGVQLRF